MNPHQNRDGGRIGNLFDERLPGTEEALKMPSLDWIKTHELSSDFPFSDFREKLIRQLEEADNYEKRVELSNKWVALINGEMPDATQAEIEDAHGCSFLYGILVGMYLKDTMGKN